MLTESPAVAKIHAVQAEYSAFETLHETDGLIDTARELDVAFIAYGPLGHGWLVDNFPYNSPEDFNESDYRRHSTYFTYLTIMGYTSNPINPQLLPDPSVFHHLFLFPPSYPPKKGGTRC